MMAIARDPASGGHWKYDTSLHAWGPDELSLPEPQRYDSQTFEWMRRMLRFCPGCKLNDVDTLRYAFAGWCCAACLPAMRAEHEKPGWYN